VVPSRGKETGGKIPTLLRTPRLTLRQLRIEDQPELVVFITDEQSYKYVESLAPDEEDVRIWVERNKYPYFLQEKAVIPFAIETANESRVVGFISLSVCDPHERPQGEFDIMIARNYRSQGYGTEAVIALVDFGFRGINLNAIRAGLDSRNVAARRMVEKAGFRLEVEHGHDREVKGELVSTAWYSMLRDDYEKRASDPARV
jgi:ribosomal-protein-alanine N-acetyltransferase